MKIELLYIEDCPNFQQCHHLLESILHRYDISSDEILTVEVKDQDEAEQLKFIGSPTIRIDGVDIDLSNPSTLYGKMCRVYFYNGKMSGTPSAEMIENSLQSHFGNL